MPPVAPLLIVTTKAEQKTHLSAAMDRCGLESVCCETSKSARELLQSQDFSVVFCEDALPDGDFRTLIREMRSRTERTPMVVISARDDWNSYLESLRAKAFDRLTLPAEYAEIERTLRAALGESR